MSDQEKNGVALAEAETADAKPSVFSREFMFGKLLRWITKGGLAVLDYGLISGSNFLLGVLLGRWMSPDQYGAYALSFSIFILVSFLYQALLLEPLSVFSGSVYRDNIRGYLKATVWMHWGISFVVCAILASVALIGRVYGHSPVFPIALTGMTIATPFVLIHGLGRRGFYLKISPGPAAFGSTFYCILVTGGVFFVYHEGWLSAFTAFLVMGFAALVSGIVMLFQLNAALDPATGRPTFRDTWKRHWEYGRWALGACVVGWVPNYVYVPVVSSFSGLAAAAELRALMNLAAPVLQTYAALSMLFLPFAARVQDEGGRAAASSLTKKLAALFVAGALAYWAVIIPLRLQIFHLLYAGKYSDSAYLVPFFAIETIVWSASLGPAILLRAMEAPRALFFANLAASGVALIFGIPATRYFGLRGVVASMIFANAVYVVVAFILHGRKVMTLKSPTLNLSDAVPAD